ncbi:hypothetical protein [Synechococcus sp. RSCCF101]|uniref:hypothetical protein n=1 Tax=Synechococcus sp. RSCCF101 TaxID=2511069 RepID=UPI0017864491|nr:hypothetical protein [Synechococcus sp. RSCCF101]
MNRSRTTTAPLERPAELAALVADLEAMLTRLRLTAIRDRLDNLLEEASRSVIR